MTRNRVCEAATLHWVGKEIEASLDEARDALEKFVEGDHDPHLIDKTVEKLHQIRGTLLVIELYGAAMFAEELEAVARVLSDSSGARTDQAFEALLSGMVALPGYLNKLQDGMADVPIGLLPLMNDLRAVRDAPLLSDTSLFTPGLEQLLDAGPAGPGMPSDALREVVRRRRHEFHLRLLNWYRAEPDEIDKALGRLSSVVEAFRDASGTVRVSRLFETAHAVMQGIHAGVIDGSVAVKLLIGRMVRALKTLNEGGEAALFEDYPLDLVKNLLYYVATGADSDVPEIAELTSRYHLVNPTSGDGDSFQDLAFLGPSAETYEAVRALLLGELTALKDRLELALHGGEPSPQGLAPVVAPLFKVSDTLGMIGLGALRRQLLKQGEMLKAALDEGKVPDEQTLMGLARDLVYAESSLQGHIQERALGDAEELEGKEGLTEGELHRHRLSVFGEIKNELAAVKTSVSTFIGDANQVDKVAKVPTHLSLAAGALKLLGHDRASDLVGQVQKYFEDAVREHRTEWSDDELVDVADIIAGIDYHVDLLGVCPNNADSALQFAETARERIRIGKPAEDEGGDGLPATPSELQAPSAGDQDRAEEFKPDGTQDVSPDAAFPASGGPAAPADLVSDAEPGADPASEAMQETPDVESMDAVPEQTPPQAEGPTEARDAAQESADQSEAIVTPPPAPPTEEMDEGDAEIHEIFVEEAREQSQIIAEHYGKWRLNPDEEESLTVFRRAFHTLKGSGRMVGASTLGEFSWAVENLLNRVIDGTLTINDDVLSFMDDVVGALPEVVEAEAERRQTTVATIPMEARAFDLVGQRPPERVETAMQALAESASGAEAGSAQETEAEVEEAAHEQGGLRLVGGTSADLEAVEESTEIAQPAEVQEIHAEEPTERALYDVDPELALIFREEVGTHLADIRIFLERCADPHQGGVAVSESVVRSFHTLHGSANMAGVPPIAEISGAAERLLKSLRGSGRRVDALSTALLIEGVDKIAEVLDVVNVSGAAEPDWRKVFEDLNGLWPRLEREALVGAEHEPEAEQEVAGAPEAGTEPTEKKAEEVPAEPPSHVPPAGPEVIPLEDELSSEPAKPEEPAPPAMGSVAATFEEAGEPETAEVAESTDLGFERDPELVATFNEEARDLFEQMEEAYGRWETGDDRAVNDMKRILHTLKGAARLAGIAQIGDLSHAFESMLGSAPAGATPPQAYLGLARRTADRLMEQGDKFAAGSAVPAFSDLVAQLESTAARGEVVEPEAPESLVEESPSVETVPADQPPEQSQQPLPGPKPAPPEQQPAKEPKRAERIRISTGLLDRMVDNVGEVGIYAARLEQQQNLSKFNLGELEQTVQRLRAQLRALEIETEAQILYRYEREGGGDEENPDFDPLELDRFSTIQELSRALAETVDDLANLRDYLQGGNRDAETLLLQQSRIVADLQNELLRTRLIPFTQQVSRLERLVRQTSASMGKRVSLSVAGRETELDRSILEHTIPLVEHLLRNAISHGIESPEERVAEGKPEEGSITLRLGRDGMDVVVTVEDDGKGLDADSIRAKAVEHGAISADQPLDDEDVYNLVTLPGISTASVLTQISGRGVGLDVVANEAKQLGGNLSISSTPGIGSAFTIRLPFTMAITDVLLVKKREDVLAVPHTVVESVVRVTPDQVRACINGDARGIEYAGHVYPLRHISQLFDEPATPLDDQVKWVPALLVRSGERRMALQVDGVLGTRQIVVKSLGPQLNVVPWLLGGTILADGKVALIVDLNSLVRMAAAEIAVKEEAEEQPARQITVMVVDDSITVRRVTSRLLERHNMNVVTAKDGVEAVALLQDNRPDVMLLDIEMPRMDGFEVARHVRNNQDTAKLPIIMITSRTGEKHRERAKTLGVSQYLGKPYQEDELLDTIFEVLAGAAE